MKDQTMVKYSKDETLVLIKADDSFVIVGDGEVSNSELVKMTNWEDVKGWVAE